MSTSNWTDAIQMNKTLRLFAVFQEVVVTPWKGVGSDDLKNLGLVSLYDRLYLYPLLLSVSWYVLLALSKHSLSNDISERRLLIDSGIFLRSGIAFETGCFWILILFSHLTLLVFRWKNFLTFIVLLCPIRLFHAYPYPFKGKWNPLKNLCSVNCILFPCFFCLILVAVFAFQFTFLSVPFNLRT